jgi:uncharacterized protein YcfJ
MQKTLFIIAAGTLAAAATTAVQAQELTGRVLSSTPLIQQVQVPRQVCTNQPVSVQQPRSGAGAAIGALAGGILGNTVGGGSGRAAATVLGVVGGAVVGDRVEGNGYPQQVQTMQQCTTQTYLENRTVGYNVTYEYAGRQYTVQMPNDPGPTVRLQVTPVAEGGSAPPLQAAEAQGVDPVVSASAGIPILMAPTVVYPAYYPRPYYYPPVGVSLNLGYSRGWGHGHWR